MAKPDYFLLVDGRLAPLLGRELHKLVADEFPYVLDHDLSRRLDDTNAMEKQFGDRQYIPVEGYPSHDDTVRHGTITRREGEAAWDFYGTYHFRHERDLLWAKLRSE